MFTTMYAKSKVGVYKCMINDPYRPGSEKNKEKRKDIEVMTHRIKGIML